MDQLADSILEEGDASDSDTSAMSIDLEDPMRDYLLSKRREEKALKKQKKAKSKGKHKDETPEERAVRKARRKAKKEKREKKLKSEGVRGVEALLKSIDQRPRSPAYDRGDQFSDQRSRAQHRRGSQERSRSPTDSGRYIRHRRQGRSRSPYSGDHAPRRSRTPEGDIERYSSSRRY